MDRHTAMDGHKLRRSGSRSTLPPDGIWLDITGYAHLQRGEHALLSDLAARLIQANFSACIALADTPGAPMRWPIMPARP